MLATLNVPGAWVRVPEEEVHTLTKGMLVAVEHEGVVTIGTYMETHISSVYLCESDGVTQRFVGRLPDAAIYKTREG